PLPAQANEARDHVVVTPRADAKWPHAVLPNRPLRLTRVADRATAFLPGSADNKGHLGVGAVREPDRPCRGVPVAGQSLEAGGSAEHALHHRVLRRGPRLAPPDSQRHLEEAVRWPPKHRHRYARGPAIGSQLAKQRPPPCTRPANLAMRG